MGKKRVGVLHRKRDSCNSIVLYDRRVELTLYVFFSALLARSTPVPPLCHNETRF
jgi:hypothetical protein